MIHLFLTCRVEPETDCKDEPKFIVFYSALLHIFSMFCFICKADSPKVSMKKYGTMVVVQQHCKNCPINWFQLEKPASYDGNLSCWKYVAKLCNIDGRCIDQ